MGKIINLSNCDDEQLSVAIKVINDTLDALKKEDGNYIHEKDSLFYAKDILCKILRKEPLISNK